jgi:hypothetical protein
MVSGYKGIFGLLVSFNEMYEVVADPLPLWGSGIMELGGERLAKYGLQRGYR